MAKAKQQFDPEKLADLFTVDGDDALANAHRALEDAHKTARTIEHWHRELVEQALECRRQLRKLEMEGKGASSEANVLHAQLDALEADQAAARQDMADTQRVLTEEIQRQDREKIESLVRVQEANREKSLLPVRHKNRDFFLADLLDYAMKDDGISMEQPIFTLATKPDLSIWSWSSKDGDRNIRVTPSVLGRATQLDKDVLIYVISQITAALNLNAAAERKGKQAPRPDVKNRTVRFRVYDYLVTTNRGVGGRDYKELQKAFERLRGTTITTDIKTGRMLVKDTFGIIERAKIVVTQHSDDDKMQAVEVTISEWLYNAVQAYEVLTIHPDYFRLRKPLERRLYELARKFCGKQPQWTISLKQLLERAGSKGTLREFRRMLKDIAGVQTLPEYLFQLDEARDMVIFTRKDQLLP